MNIEKLQKMSELAKELKQHGLVDSSEDAMNQADTIVNEGKFIEIKNLLNETESEVHELSLDERRENSKIVEFSEKITSQNSKIEQLSSTVLKMQDSLNEIVAEMMSMKEKTDSINKVNDHEEEVLTNFVNQPKKEEQPSEHSELEVKFEESTQLVQQSSEQSSEQISTSPKSRRGMYSQEETTQNHPRQGKYTPSDVSIETFFNTNNMR